MIVIGPVIAALNDLLLKFFLIAFGYVIPILFSVKAVLHEDLDARRQWVAYWTLLTALRTPMVETIVDAAVHPWIKVLVLLWLSLPRYSGALVVLSRLVWTESDGDDDFSNNSDKGHLESFVRAVDTQMGALRDRFWCFVWESVRDGTAQQLLFTMQTFWSTFTGAESTTTTENTHPSEDNISISHPSPLHTVRIANDRYVGAEGEEAERYVSDFLDMLTRGLFVFSLISSHSNENNDGDSDDEYRLRIFSLERDDGTLALCPVGEGRRSEASLFPVHEIDSIFESEDDLRGITISCNDTRIVKIVLSTTEDRDTLLEGLLNAYLPSF